MVAPRYRVLVIGDPSGDARPAAEISGSQPVAILELECAGSLAGAMQRLQCETFDAVLLSLALPDSSGMETYERIHCAFPALCTIVLTAGVDVELALRAVELGARDYLLEPELRGGFLARTIHYAIQRQRDADRLRASERLHREVVDAFDEGLWLIDDRLRTTFVNGAVAEMLGCDRSEIHGRTPLDFVRSADRAAAERHFAAVTEHAREQFELDLLRMDGRALRVLMRVRAMPSGDGQFTGALAVMTDITAPRSVEESLGRTEWAFRLAQEVARIAHWQWDARTGETFWSGGVSRILEVPAGTASSFEVLQSAIDPDHRSEFESVLARLFEPGAAIRADDLDVEVITPSGIRKTLAVRLMVDRDAAGRVMSARGTIQDITERKATEEVLRQRTATLERANAELERFNRAAVGRELRMIELKTEVNRLYAELGRAPRYAVSVETTLEGEIDASQAGYDLIV